MDLWSGNYYRTTMPGNISKGRQRAHSLFALLRDCADLPR
jgi:hypothetical protein